MIKWTAPALLLLLAACSQNTDTTADDPPPPSPKPAPAPAKEFSIVWKTPPEWKQQEASGLRQAVCAVPDKDKAEADAIFIYFGTMGGGIEGNFGRWKGQFQNSTESKTEEFKAGDLTVHLLDIVGEYASDMGSDAKPDQRGLFAIVESQQGHHIFRLTGPRGTVGDWRDAFVELLKGLKNRGA